MIFFNLYPKHYLLEIRKVSRMIREQATTLLLQVLKWEVPYLFQQLFLLLLQKLPKSIVLR